MSRFQYPPTVKVVRLTCTGSLDPLFVFEALQKGADGVLIGGCKLGECHYTNGNYHAQEKVRLIKKLLAQIGCDPDRVRLEWISAAEGERFATIIKDFTQELKAKGPSPVRQEKELCQSNVS